MNRLRKPLWLLLRPRLLLLSFPAWRPLDKQYHTNNRETTHRNGVTDHCRLVRATYHCLSFHQFRPVCHGLSRRSFPTTCRLRNPSSGPPAAPSIVQSMRRSVAPTSYPSLVPSAVPSTAVHRVKLEPQELCDSCAFGGLERTFR